MNKRKRELKDAVRDCYGQKIVTAVSKAVPTAQSANELALAVADPTSVKLVVGALDHLKPALGICPISYAPNIDPNKSAIVPLIPGSVGGHLRVVHKPTWEDMPLDANPFGNGHKREEWSADMVFKLPESQHPSGNQYAELIGEGGMADASIGFQNLAELLEIENKAARAKAAANAKKAAKKAEAEAAARKAEAEATANKAAVAAAAAANKAVAYAQAAKEASLLAKERDLNKREAMLNARDNCSPTSPSYSPTNSFYLQ